MNQKSTRFFLVKMAASFPSKPQMQSIPMQIGLCLPASCNHAGVVDLIKSPAVKLFLPELDPKLDLVQVSNITAASPQLDMKYENAGGVIAAVIVGLLVLLVVASTTATLAKQASSSSRRLELPQHQQQAAG